MSVVDLYNVCRLRFQSLAEKVDREHSQQWGDVDSSFTHLWFESLASVLNQEMSKGIDVGNYIELFEFFNEQLQTADEEIKRCIDVAFTENLFWQVEPSKASVYWAVLPDKLKALYLDFHHRKPI